MKTRIMLVALIMAAVIGSSVGVGYAGSAGGALSDNPSIPIWQCYMVGKGSTSPSPSESVIEFDDDFSSKTVERVGKLKLVCAITDWHVVANNDGLDDLGAVGDRITCYEVSPTQATPSDVTVKDAFGKQMVQVQGSSVFVCTKATEPPPE